NSFSLAKAFYQAGARYVLATLWPVSDQVSHAFMSRFYARLRATDDVVASYRTAQAEIAATAIDPALWGAFVLLGM
ncbi:MAG TPA: CHAT domain-containing protein, partial [candidate division Zixibacteria bacterium]|nr:CHAT domain-containing protein [candidate division Zixibacteria bacterium]